MRYSPLPKQRKAYGYLKDRKTKYLLYGGSAGCGKSHLGCEWLLLSAYHLPGTRWFVGRNNLKDTRQSVLVTWTKVCNLHGYNQYRTNNDSIILGNGSEIVFLDLSYYPYKDPLFERLGSKEFTGGWIEEAGEVTGKAFEVLKSRIGRHLNKEMDIPPKILITCNPKKNWLYHEFYLPWRKGELNKDMVFVQALPGDNPFLTAEYLEALESIKDPVTKARLLHGEWEYEDDDHALVTYSAIRDTLTNGHVLPNPSDKWITADIALEGSDKLVVGVWYGWVLVEVRMVGKAKSNDVVGVIEAMKIRHGIPNSQIIYDDDGVGAFVGGFIRGATQFNNGGKVENGENYENLKSQCYYKLADRVNESEIYLRALSGDRELEEVLTQEFEQQLRSRDINREGTLAIRRKKDVRTALGRSPDLADMIMMRLYPTVRKERRGRRSSFS